MGQGLRRGHGPLCVGGDVGVLHSSGLEPASPLSLKGRVFSWGGGLFLGFPVLKKKSCNFVIFFYLLNHLLYFFCFVL